MTERRRMVWGIAMAGLILAVSAGLAAASDADLISSDLAVRGVMVVIGLVTLVGSGNLAPKIARSTAPTAHAQSATRFFGWAMTLAGLILWTFAPIGVAKIAAPAGVVTVLVVWILFLLRRGKSDGLAPPL